MSDSKAIVTPETFCVNLFLEPLPTAGDDSTDDIGDAATNGDNLAVNSSDMTANCGDSKRIILGSLATDCKISTMEIAKTTSAAKRAMERYIKGFREEEKLVRHGSARGGYWKVVKPKSSTLVGHAALLHRKKEMPMQRTGKLTSSNVFAVNPKTGALILSSNHLEDYATKYLTKHCKKALITPMV